MAADTKLLFRAVKNPEHHILNPQNTNDMEYSAKA